MTDAGIGTCTICGEPVCGGNIYPGPTHAGCYEQLIRTRSRVALEAPTEFPAGTPTVCRQAEYKGRVARDDDQDAYCRGCGRRLDPDDEALGFCEDC